MHYIKSLMNYLKILKSKFVTKSHLQFYIVHKGRNSVFLIYFLYLYTYLCMRGIYIYIQHKYIY